VLGTLDPRLRGDDGVVLTEGADAGGRQRGQDRDWMDIALIEDRNRSSLSSSSSRSCHTHEMEHAMAGSASKTDSHSGTPGFVVDAAVDRAKRRALVAWFFAPPKLPTYPPVDYSQEPAAARAARQRRVQAQVDDLLTPINPADIAYRSFLR
jgi:hypothetical protein